MTLAALTVSGATTLAAFSCTTLTASGAVAFQSTFAVTTSTSLAALSCTTLTASGAVAFQSTFAVTGNLTAANLTNARIGYLDNINNATLAAASFPTDPADESLVIAATDAIMSRLGSPAGASVSADVAAVKTDTAAVKLKTDQLTFTVALHVDATASVDTSGIAAGVWDLATSGHTTAGTFGAAMAAAGSAGDPWSTAEPGAYASGTFGYLVANRLPEISTILGLLDAQSTTFDLNLVSPADGGTVEIIRGNDYLDADGRALTFNSTTALTIDGAALTIQQFQSDDVEVAGVVSGSAGAWVIKFDLPHAATADLERGNRACAVRVTLDNDDVITVVRFVAEVKTHP